MIRRFWKIALWTPGAILGLYALLCLGYYFTQDRMLFPARSLPADHAWNFPGRYTEHFIPASDGTLLDGLLCRADTARGVVFFLHGNSETLADLGAIAHVYTGMQYD